MNAEPVFEINLCCPECGSVEWFSEDSMFKCIHCGCEPSTDEMVMQVFEI